MSRGNIKNVLFMPWDWLSEDKQAEGCAVNWAFFSGACDKCRYLEKCETTRGFTFPKDAACMQKKQEVLEEWHKK